MAETLPINFSIPPEVNLINYNWYDIESGSGYINFYLAKDEDSYIMTNNEIASDMVFWFTTTITGDYVKVFDNAFTMTLNKSQIVNGNVLASISANAYGAGGTSCYFVVKFIKVVGVTETTIAETTSATQTYTGGVFDHESTFLCSMPVTNTSINSGEKMGLRLEFYVRRNSGSTPNYAFLGTDPFDRESQQYPTSTYTNQPLHSNTILSVPFKIDV